MKGCRKQFLDWVVYQIYPRSFKDSNGDGIGDLNGIRQKLGHLEELGVNAVWICPCYKSPNVDNGYDVADYRDIMDEFGTLDDWKKLVEEMRERGIKIIMDLVPNHCSSEHKWFKEGRSSRDNPYHDYFYWAETPPNDWKSCFGGSAWEYNEPTGEYYLHGFAVEQPDLNWENPKVRREFRDIVDYWVGLGVDGFRCDVLDYISKDLQGECQNGPRLHEYIRELFDRKKVENIFTVGECGGANENSVLDICGEDRGELTCIFQFDHFSVANSGNKFVEGKLDLDTQLKDTLVRWQTLCEKNDLLYTLFTDNHDHQRFITLAGDDGKKRYESATMFATMFYLLRGIPFIYQGQEIGMTGSNHRSMSAFKDVETWNYYREHCELSEEEMAKMASYGSRDNARRPIPWTEDEKDNHGFSSGEPWIAPYARADEINVERDKAAERSVFAYYQNLLRFRKETAAIRYGTFRDVTQGRGYFAYEREYEGERFLVVCNFEKERDIDLPEGEYSFVFGNGGEKREGNGMYAPYETAVYKIVK